MNQKKIQTLGEFIHHLLDHEEAVVLRKQQSSEDGYRSWVFKQIDQVFFDEENPNLTFELMEAPSSLRSVFQAINSVSDNVNEFCPRCYERMKIALKANQLKED
jgi:hypothetical protein